VWFFVWGGPAYSFSVQEFILAFLFCLGDFFCRPEVRILTQFARIHSLLLCSPAMFSGFSTLVLLLLRLAFPIQKVSPRYVYFYNQWNVFFFLSHEELVFGK